MKFRPCIDLHNGKVKQIVGGSLTDGSDPETNFVSEKPPAWYAEFYKKDGLTGGHVIKLGKGNTDAAKEALAAWPGGLQVGGGIAIDNAKLWINDGASHIIVTSYLFQKGQLDPQRLDMLLEAVGSEKLVIDLSCRKKDGNYYVVTDRWQTFTDFIVNEHSLKTLGGQCAEFLIHGVDVEGKQQGMEEDLIKLLADHCPIPCTYAGGVRNFDDLERLNKIGGGRIDVTIGSALDIFGGKMSYEEVVKFCAR